jgi:hypothetical protein
LSYLSKIKSAKVYETLLWLTFLVTTFFIGFFHGSSPEKQINFYYQDTKKVDILVQQEGILGPALIKYLEKETHSQINIIVRKSYKDFRTEIIVNKNLILALSPEAFIEPLFNDNRIKNIDILAKLIHDSVHSDFQPSLYGNQVYSLPLSWFVNVFSESQKFPRATYIDYSFLLNQKKRNHYFSFNKNFELERKWTQIFNLNEAFETTLQLATLKNQKYKIDRDLSFLITFGLTIPNNTPDRKLSMDLLKLMLISKEVKSLLTDNGLGQTFIDPRLTYSVAHFIAPESIRNLDLKNFKNGNKSFDEAIWNAHSLIEH